MTGDDFFRKVTNGEADILQLLVSMLEDTGTSYCVIGGLAVNAYAEPVISLDLDIVVISSQIDGLRSIAEENGMTVKEFTHSINLSVSGSDLRIQIQKSEDYQAFVPRAVDHDIFGHTMKVACLEDVLQGKIWAYSDTDRRKSKRQKDLADILRLVETHPELAKNLPPEIAREL